MKRSSGILMHISSLPSPYGIGTFGKAAYDFADFLSAAGQSYWQILPTGITGASGSPYQSISAFALNPSFIDLDFLEEGGLLERGAAAKASSHILSDKVDFAAIEASRRLLLAQAFSRAGEKLEREVEEFAADQPWLEDFALFAAAKERFGQRAWTDWDDEALRRRSPEAIEKYSELLRDKIAYHKFVQYICYSQWDKLRAYVNSLGIDIIGDIPIYVSADSADVWAHQDEFILDSDGRPTLVAGVPPDYFSKDGQLWGNPLYDWDAMQKNGYKWWIDRIGASSRIADVIRIDHFRGLSSYWAVPADAKTAATGEWKTGPGISFVRTILGWFKNTRFIAEDLGDLTPDVYELMRESGLPGMKVLQFAFNDEKDHGFLPHMSEENSVFYTGTHDNDTLIGWLNSADHDALAYATKYMGLNSEEGYDWGMIRTAMSSRSNLAVFQMQDFLSLDTSARMNTPATTSGNWQWRMEEGAANAELAKRIYYLTKIYDRI